MNKQEQKIWGFALKEICINLECSKVAFVLDNDKYNKFKRRFEYFINKNEI